MTGHESPLAALRTYGHDAVSFQSLEDGLSWWHDGDTEEGSGASIAYADTGRSWIAVGSPFCDRGRLPAAIDRFIDAARAARRRPVFFAVEDPGPFPGCRHLLLGLQSVVLVDVWPATLRKSRKLREQLRRARAQRVTTRLVEPHELVAGAPMRRAADTLARAWLGSRHIDPMQFVVSVEPFHEPEEHLYLVAERDGVPVQFLSAVPIYTRGGWLLEDMLRGRQAPNGTTELLLDRLFSSMGSDAWMTQGLTPLAGNVTWWLRLVGRTTSALYDFAGLQRFRARLHPSRWDPVWLVWDRGPAWLVLLDVLRAFAGGRRDRVDPASAPGRSWRRPRVGGLAADRHDWSRAGTTALLWAAALTRRTQNPVTLKPSNPETSQPRELRNLLSTECQHRVGPTRPTRRTNRRGGRNRAKQGDNNRKNKRSCVVGSV